MVMDNKVVLLCHSGKQALSITIFTYSRLEDEMSFIYLFSKRNINFYMIL